MRDATTRERDPVALLLRRDRWIVLGGLATLTLLTAAESQGIGRAMTSAQWPVCGSSGPRWGIIELGTTALMWGVMMVAMMTPAASPMVLAFAGLERRRIGNRGTIWRHTGTFLTGYLLVWMGFSLLAASVQWALHSTALLSDSGMRTAGNVVDAVLLVAAGLFQFSSLKAACLKHCRTPVGFLLSAWRPGVDGAFVMGSRHGMYCVGCCWLLMALLFVVGVMNTLWGAALAALVVAERILPGGRVLARAVGVALVLAAGGSAAGVLQP
jgi:predicted metal-binding membrane protein